MNLLKLSLRILKNFSLTKVSQKLAGASLTLVLSQQQLLATGVDDGGSYVSLERTNERAPAFICIISIRHLVEGRTSARKCGGERTVVGPATFYVHVRVRIRICSVFVLSRPHLPTPRTQPTLIYIANFGKYCATDRVRAPKGDAKHVIVGEGGREGGRDSVCYCYVGWGENGGGGLLITTSSQN